MSIRPDPKNSNKGTQRGRGLLEKSLRQYGAGRSVLADKHGTLIAGNKTAEVAEELGLPHRIIQTDGHELIVVQRTDLDLSTDVAAVELGIADNRVGEVSLDWDVDVLAELSADVDLSQFWGDDELAALLGTLDIDTDGSANAIERASLADRFVVPPFSVLDARQGYWQERKQHWLAYGIESGLGRGQNALDMSAGADAQTFGTGGPGTMDEQRAAWRRADNADSDGNGPARTSGQDLIRGEHVVGESTLGAIPPNERASSARSGKYDTRAIRDHEWQARVLGKVQAPQPGLTWVGGQREWDDLDDVSQKILLAQPQSGTSIFDPVLCELAYRWFCPPGGLVLDPFAGGSVRGVMACLLDRDYIGVDLSGRQLHANEEQAERITPGRKPRWIEGDSVDVLPTLEDDADFVFSCPPYADLEVYSDDPRDLSTMDYAAFLSVYRAIIAAAVARLRDDRFACFVVGDVRDKRGMYRNFVSDTIAAFQDAGAALYNEAILVTAVGSLPIRVSRQFEAGRKLGKTHQNVLVFIKGDPKRAVAAIGPCDFGDVPTDEEVA